MGMLAVLGL